MEDPSIWFEDLNPGDERELTAVTVTAEDISAFARQWDPQPMHLDEAAAADSFLGRLTASGWHSCCILMRQMCDSFLLDSSSMGSPGIEEVRWMRPVEPGDRLTGRQIVLDKRVSKKRPDLGIVRCRYELANQRGETVLSATFPAFFRCRQVAEVAS